MEERVPTVPEAPSIPTIKEKLDYITDTTVKAKAKELFDFFPSLGPEISVDPTKSGTSVKKSNRVFRYVYCNRKNVVVGFWGPDGQWSDVQIWPDTNLDDIKAGLKASFEQTS